MMHVRNPRTGKNDYTFQPISLRALHVQAQRMREAQLFWAKQSVNYRIEVLQNWKKAVQRHRQELIQVVCADTGRYWETVLEIDIVASSIDRWCQFAAEQSVIPQRKSTANPCIDMDGMNIPYALVGVICPWNFPLLLSLIDTIPALLTGCAVMVKPSEITPRFIPVMERILDEVPVLRDVLRYVEGGAETGTQLVDLVDLICFTGSTATGKKVYQMAAQRFIPVFLELGGKDPAIVLESADIEKAASAIAWGGLVNAGQSCLSIERIYVQESVYELFLEKLTQKVNQLGLNHLNIQQGHIGPIIAEKQVKIINTHLQDALKLGATMMTGSARCEKLGGGNYCRPTVLRDVNHEMRVMTEETFGPILPVMPFKGVEQAIALANDSIYGLSGSVFAGTVEEALELAQYLQIGATSINDAALTGIMHEAEKNSFKMSGLGGTRMGPRAMKRFTRRKAFLIKNNPMASPWWFKE